MIKRLIYQKRLMKTKPQRYINILKTIYSKKPNTILEIGVFNGKRAIEMIETASIHTPIKQIKYYGFDLFEMLTEDELIKEFSKKPLTYKEIESKLNKTKAQIKLYMGYSQDTLPQFIKSRDKKEEIDFIFIDGGHSIETISADWNNIQQLISPNSTVIFDDFYSNSEHEIQGAGCQSLINSLDKNIYDIKILEPQDSFDKSWGTLKINMVKISLKH